ncbi:mRNA cleavage and polyadenylation specificity factor complex subunit pta1 [Pleurostoma richardsiae]|uniref:mRNA cleavage and polyadenylation specificity factor complex subunit pta1 n=1 Tax=Pleurostoma richardsiae TaxID=41990 RepID=A0AA38R592_9PEZI|nr:mRNA cleavage and polyadenylation specificity factor complex subunit pta1 [Pleurostoma richardsiae]
MAAPAPLSVSEQLRQLNDARKLVLSDVSYYSPVVQGILPIIGPSALPELRRWGADFLAEAFAAPAFPSRDKETLSLTVLETLKAMVENPNEDVYVLKSVIQTSASIYPLAMRWIINNSYDATTWERMTAIKTRILRIWDGAPTPIRLCCIKFAQRVVLAQTAAANMEQKRDGLEVSLSMVPPNHPVLDPRILEAEATGLLDRMLGVLQDDSSDALVVDGTLNTLSILVRTRPGTSSRILNAVLNFNPLKLAASPMTPKTRVLVKSMEKTTRMLLIHIAKRDPQNPFTPRIQQYVERLIRSRAEIFDDASRKRALAEQAAYSDAKRQRLGAETATISQMQIQPLAPGPNSLAAVFTLTSNPGLQGFDVSQVPAALAARISVSTLATLNPQTLDVAINGIRDRLSALSAAQPPVLNPDTAPLGVEEDDDDYEPDFYPAEDTEQILNKLDSAPPEGEAPKTETTSLALGAFRLPPPPPLNSDAAAVAGQGTITRVFSSMKTLEDPAVKKAKAGINRLAASSYDRESWLTVIARLATRASAGLEDVSVKDEGSSAIVADSHRSVLSNVIRESLYTFILEDFRRRIELAVSWLCEEWYNDALQRKQSADAPLYYDKWALKLVDGFVPYLNPQDKVLTRFLGEIPELNPAILARVKSLCRDPSMVQLALTSLLYLVMMRPPARGIALDTVQDIWIEYEDARPMAGKYLVKWRPGFVEAQTASAEGGANSGTANVAIAT